MCKHFCAAQLSTISVFYKQRNNYFFPVTSYALPTVLLRVPLSVVTGIIFTALTYFVVGFAPDVGRCVLLVPLNREIALQMTILVAFLCLPCSEVIHSLWCWQICPFAKFCTDLHMQLWAYPAMRRVRER